ncbi:MAG: NADAR family protein [Pseudomonadota bacterium]
MNDNHRIYEPSQCCVFRKTKEAFGGLSNMAAGYPLVINGTKILTSEAFYQACRYPHLPEVQSIIIDQKSPMTAKMKSKFYYSQSRTDWENIKIAVMRWSLRVKLAQNFMTFGLLLESTNNKPIVESSKRDIFWGAIKSNDGNLRGLNILGRLLMELRESYSSETRYQLLFVPTLQIDNFKMLDKEISVIDERLNFFKSIFNNWQLTEKSKNDEDLYKQLINYLVHDSGNTETITGASIHKGLPLQKQLIL